MKNDCITRGGGKIHCHRAPHRHRHRADAGDALVGINEQPFPVVADHLHAQRRLIGSKRLVGIQLVRITPHKKRQHRHDYDWAAPGSDLQWQERLPFGCVARRLGPVPVTPGKKGQQQEDRSRHQHRHNPKHPVKMPALGRGDRTLRIEKAQMRLGTATADHQQCDGESK
jgi:hypothetical protein